MTSSTRSPFLALLAGATIAVLPLACSGSSSSSSDDGRPPAGETGSSCELPSECYPGVPAEDLKGEALCLDKVEGGYCTHACEADTDCCAVDGECPGDRAEVCSPFESSPGKMCLLSCEDDDVASDADAADANDYCERNAGSAFSCRSSGGGSENRKVCMPIDCSGGLGDACTKDDDCGGDLSCDETLAGGYCSEPGCTKDDDCQGDGLCAKNGSESRCVRPCDNDGDCSSCRDGATGTTCQEAVELIDGKTASACL